MRIPETQHFLLPSGAEIEIETLPGRGAREAASDDKKPRLAEVIQPLGEVAQLLVDQIRSIAKAPDEVSVELGAAFKGKCSVPEDYVSRRSYPLFRAREVLEYLAAGGDAGSP